LFYKLILFDLDSKYLNQSIYRFILNNFHTFHLNIIASCFDCYVFHFARGQYVYLKSKTKYPNFKVEKLNHVYFWIINMNQIYHLNRDNLYKVKFISYLNKIFVVSILQVKKELVS